MVKAFEDGWGDSLPVLKGDFTEYWTDGLGTKAEMTGRSREVKERLVQAETLWSMLRPNEGEPHDLVREAWRNMIMGTEHTWALSTPGHSWILTASLSRTISLRLNRDCREMSRIS